MPKCLDCNNTQYFWYVESSTKLGKYDEAGELIDVIKDYWDEPEHGRCDKCQSENIEGKL